jgi:hypothetical protein
MKYWNNIFVVIKVLQLFHQTSMHSRFGGKYKTILYFVDVYCKVHVHMWY